MRTQILLEHAYETSGNLLPNGTHVRNLAFESCDWWCQRGYTGTRRLKCWSHGTPAARVPPWSGAERAAHQLSGDGRHRGGRPHPDDAAPPPRAGPLVTVAAAALHRVGACRAPGDEPGAAALACQARAVAPGRR